MSELSLRYCKCGHALDEHLDERQCVRCQCIEYNDATTDYTARLSAFGITALKRARRAMNESGGVVPFFMLEHCDGQIDFLVVPNEVAESVFGNPRLKAAFFGAIRDTVLKMKVRMLVFVSDARCGRPTELGAKMPQREFIDLVGRDIDEAVIDGIIESAPALTASVQTPERMMMMIQYYERNVVEQRILWGEMMRIEGTPGEFGGMTRVFGDEVAS